MGKPDPEASRTPRKRQLNVIYFVDAARTRSLTIPLGRLRLVVATLALLVVWSIGSAVAIGWLQRDKLDLASRLSASLATIFEYESRYDQVYETAYPADGRIPRETALAAASHAPTESEAPPAQESAPEAVAKPAAPQTTSPQPAPRVAAAAPTTAAPQVETPPAVEIISVSNPVIEPKASALELRFDLTNKTGKARAEGFVWAVAEFKGDDGQTLFLGAPDTIQVTSTSEPRHPERSAPFGIKHFKKKVFQFPYPKGRTGTFVGIKIGVMGRTGDDRLTYNVPIELRHEGPRAAAAPATEKGS